MAKNLTIIGGQFKGMRLYSPPEGKTRPLSGIAKKSLFDSLGETIVGANCLDLFAGSGSIGIEAVSRGASRCTFVENDPAIIKVLQKNVDKILDALDNDAVRLGIRCETAADYLSRRIPNGEWFDIVFIDPPFADEKLLSGCLELLKKNKEMISLNSIVYAHIRKGTEYEEDGWEIFDLRRFGEDLHIKYRLKAQEHSC